MFAVEEVSAPLDTLMCPFDFRATVINQLNDYEN